LQAASAAVSFSPVIARMQYRYTIIILQASDKEKALLFYHTCV